MIPMYTSNQSDMTALEGLYITETPPALQVQGQALNKIGICGETVRGPDGVIVEVSEPAEFASIFGGPRYVGGTTIKNKIWQALLNKPFGPLAIVRTVAAAAAAGSYSCLATTTPVVTVTAGSKGAWSVGTLTVDVVAATDGEAHHFNLVVHYGGGTWTLQNLNCYTSSDDNLETVRQTIWDDNHALIKLTKASSGRPDNVAAAAVAGGTDGSIADGDFSAAGGGMELINGYKGVAICMVAERDSSTLDTKIAALAGATNDRMWLVAPDAYSTAYTDAITDAGTVRSDRIIYCFNNPVTIDTSYGAGVSVTTSPKGWMAAILSQLDVDVNPGSEEAKPYLAGISSLSWPALTRANYVSMKAAGIAALAISDDGFEFESAVTTSLTSGLDQIDRRRSVDFLVLGMAGYCKHLVKAKNTLARRRATAGAITGWLTDLATNGRIIDVDANNAPVISVDTESLNTTAQRAAGLEKLYVGGRLIGHALYFNLVANFSTGFVSGA